jgi:hypothetical protein
MIQVQIASQVTATGLDGIRWVLVEDAEGALGQTMPSAPSAVQPAAVAMPSSVGGETRRMLTLVALKGTVALTAFGVALWTAFQVLGAPVVPGSDTEGPSTGIRRVVPAEGSLQSIPAPAAPAGSAATVVTAELR